MMRVYIPTEDETRQQQLALRMVQDQRFAESVANVALAGFRSGSRNREFCLSLDALQGLLRFPIDFRDALAGITATDRAGRIRQFQDSVALAAPTTDADAPAFVTRNFAEYWTAANFDQRVFQAFMRTTFEANRDFFEIGKGDWNVEFRKRRTFEPAPMSDASQVKGLYGYDSYHGGRQWDEFLGEATNAASLIGTTQQIARGAAVKNADVTYQTLTASALLNPVIPYNSTGSSDLEDRILTLNDARDIIAEDFKDEVGVDITTTSLLIFVNAKPSRIQQLRTALEFDPTTSNLATIEGNTVEGPYTVLPTWMLRNALGAPLDDRYVLMVVPGRENQYADKRALSFAEGDDWSRRLKGIAGELAFGAGCNNSLQNRVVQLWT